MARLATKWEKTLETHITEGDSIKNIQSYKSIRRKEKWEKGISFIQNNTFGH